MGRFPEKDGPLTHIISQSRHGQRLRRQAVDDISKLKRRFNPRIHCGNSLQANLIRDLSRAVIQPEAHADDTPSQVTGSTKATSSLESFA
jgi:hypothetical protein